MQDRVDDPPIVRCPGEAKERTPVTERLVDIRYVCRVRHGNEAYRCRRSALDQTTSAGL
jgi:hypothetical protein